MSSIAKAPWLGLAAALTLAGCASTTGAPEAETARAPASGKAAPTIGGATVDPARTIAANAAEAPNLTTLVKAIRAAGLDSMLAGAGPYTLFAPTNDAFARLAPGTVETLLKPENKISLVKLLNYHIVPGAISTKQIRAQMETNAGTTTLTTLEGDPLTITLTGNIITLRDVNGNKSYIQGEDISQSNGIIQVVNGVMIPNLG